jgi:hypothetical protein
MNDFAFQRPPAEPSSPSIATEGSARPKIMRRPAQFSGSLPAAIPALPAIAAAPTKPETAPTRPAWQDDGRFGVALVLSILVVNIALMILLPRLGHTSEGSIAAPPSSISSVMPDIGNNVDGADNAAVTLYAPADAPRRTSFDLGHLDDAQNKLSVSPRDVPAPRARALTAADME